MFSEALDYGLETGVSIPFHSATGEKSMLVIHSPNIDKLLQQHNQSLQHTLHILGLYFHQQITDLLDTNNKPQIQLTKREIQCLQLTMLHKNAAEIAEALSISKRTVGFHIENANHKLECKNKYQSVLKALQLGLLK